MKIGDKEIREIIITDEKNKLLVSITDENIIQEASTKDVYIDCKGAKHEF